ncbi:MAG: M56 family metallopeptidase [Actinoplanes sp.]
MFDHFLWSVLVCPVLVALAVRHLADRLRPDTAVLFAVGSIGAAAVASLVNLAAFAVKAVAELPAVAGRFGFSAAQVRADTARVPWVSWLSVGLLLGAFATMSWVWRTHRRDAAFARQYATMPADDDRVVLLDDAQAEAFAVPGRPGRIVVTTGMRAALNDSQYAALLAHERAHLAAGHHRLVQLARLSAAAHPVFWWPARRVEYLVERAADERAATELGDRRVVARAIGTAALVSARSDGGPQPGTIQRGAGWSGTPSRGGATSRGGAALRVAPAGRDLRRAGVVPRRVASLIAPRRAGSLVLSAVPAAMAASSVAWTGECVLDLGELLHAAGLF